MNDNQISVGDIVTLVKSGNKAKVMRLDTGGAELGFLDDIAFAKEHGLPFTGRDWVWFPSEEFTK